MNDDAEIVKRSLLLAKHRTSASLERAYWRELEALAKEQKKSLNKLATEIDATREGNLSSALRLYVLSELKDKIKS